jgi:hypothetical protein
MDLDGSNLTGITIRSISDGFSESNDTIPTLSFSIHYTNKQTNFITFSPQAKYTD